MPVGAAGGAVCAAVLPLHLGCTASQERGNGSSSRTRGRVDEGAPQAAGTAPENATEDEDDPMAAYRALRRRGWSHADIVDMLAKNVVAALNEADEQHQARAASSSRIV